MAGDTWFMAMFNEMEFNLISFPFYSKKQAK